MATSTSLNFDLFARDRTASATFRSFGKSVDNSNRSVKVLRVGLSSLVKGFVALAVIQKTTQFFSDSIAEARESNKVGAQTQAVLKSTGHASQVTARHVSDLAEAISEKSGIDDEAVQSGENLLLTFKNVRNEAGQGNRIFDRATRIITDMSVAMGTDLKSANIQVGKALNDPIKGITALTRVGVTFSEKQKETIKKLVESGHAMKAQKMILRELNSEFKGSAAAQADPADKAKVAWENFKESIGLRLMPVLNKLLIWFTTTALPAITKFGSFLSRTLGPAIDWVKNAFAGAKGEGGGFSAALSRVVASGQQVYAALKPIAVDIYNKIKQNWPQIKQTVTQVMNDLASTISSVAETITVLWDKFGNKLLTVAGNTVRQIATTIRGLLRIVRGIFKIISGVLTGDWGKAWDGVKDILSGAKMVIVGKVRELMSNINTVLGGLPARLWAKFTSAWGRAKSATSQGVAKVVGFIKSLPGKITSALGDLSSLLFDAGASVISGFVNGLKSKVGDVANVLKDVTSMIPKLKGPLDKDKVLLKPAGKAIMDGLIEAIKSRKAALAETLSGITESVRSSFGHSVFGSDSGVSMRMDARAQRNDTRTLARDVKKLIGWGLSDTLLRQLAESGDYAGIHELATSSRQNVRGLNRDVAAANRNLNRVGNMIGRETTQDQRKGLHDAVADGIKKGLEGARLKIDNHGNATLLIRGGVH